jgi:dUTP pyrophosphatase
MNKMSKNKNHSTLTSLHGGIDENVPRSWENHPMQIKFKKLHPKAVIPTRAHDTDAGYDLTCVSVERSINGDMLVVDTGIAMEIPEGWYGAVMPRSSISKTGLMLSNSCGTIDSGYRGSITFKFLIINNMQTQYEAGDRIGQIIIRKLEYVEFVEVDELGESERGAGGFGSTGR